MTLSSGEHRKRAAQFKKGQSGNPSGRPPGARSKLSEEFLKALYNDFKDHGAAAIMELRAQSVQHYLRLVASLVQNGWFGENEDGEPIPLPVVFVDFEHEIVRSPHALC